MRLSCIFALALALSVYRHAYSTDDRLSHGSREHTILPLVALIMTDTSNRIRLTMALPHQNYKAMFHSGWEITQDITKDTYAVHLGTDNAPLLVLADASRYHDERLST